VPHAEQEMFILPEHLISRLVFIEVYVIPFMCVSLFHIIVWSFGVCVWLYLLFDCVVFLYFSINATLALPWCIGKRRWLQFRVLIIAGADKVAVQSILNFYFPIFLPFSFLFYSIIFPNLCFSRLYITFCVCRT